MVDFETAWCINVSIVTFMNFKLIQFHFIYRAHLTIVLLPLLILNTKKKKLLWGSQGKQAEKVRPDFFIPSHSP